MNKNKTILSVNGIIMGAPWDSNDECRGGRGTPWTGNWVVCGETPCKLSRVVKRTQTPKCLRKVGRLADINPKAETWVVGGHTQR